MNKTTILPMQALKGIFALLIVCSHLRFDSGYLLTVGGEAGVAFFFMASGWLMYLRHRDSGRNYGRFMLLRAVRLYPIHLICLCLYLLFVPAPHGISALPRLAFNITLLQSWVPKPEFFFSYNAVSWFLSDILLCYALTPVLTRLAALRRPQLILASIAVAGGYLAASMALPVGQNNYWIYIFPPMRLADFFAGMLFCRASMALNDRRPTILMRPASKNFIELASLLSVVAAFIIWPGEDSRWGVSILWWIPMGALTVAMTAGHKGFATRFLSRREPVWLGDISLGIFLLQLTVIKGTERILPFPDPHLNPWGYAMYCAALVAGVIVAAWLLHRYLLPRLPLLTSSQAKG